MKTSQPNISKGQTVTRNFIGKYEVLELLGKGSMGLVYKARDPEIGRLVAIKKLRVAIAVNEEEGSEGSDALKRFRQESRSAGRLVHPNIITIFEAGRDEDGCPFIVMEYIQATGVDSFIEKNGSIEPLTVVHYLSHIASALDYAHQRGVIHRDIKPSNIIVDEDDKPYIVDFGVAKLNDTSMTPTGTVVGTPSYMSPEQIRGNELDGRTDIFSLGVLTYEMLTGTRPFIGKNFTAVVSSIINKEPASFSDLGVSINSNVESVVRKCLEKEPSKRFETAAQFVNVLQEALNISAPKSKVVDTSEIDDSKLVFDDIAKNKSTKKVNVANRILAANEILENKANLLDIEVEKLKNEKEIDELSFSKRSFIFVAFSIGLAGILLYSLIFTKSPKHTLKTTALKIPEVSNSELAQMVTSDFIQSDEITEVDDVTEAGDVTEAKEEKVDYVSEQDPLPDIEIPKEGFTRPQLQALNDLELLSVIMNADDLSTVREALSEAAERSKPMFTSSMLAKIEDSRFQVRIDAIKALGSPFYSKQIGVFESLMESLADNDSLVRGFAVKAIAKYKNSNSKSVLEKTLQKEKNDIVIKVINQELEKL